LILLGYALVLMIRTGFDPDRRRRRPVGGSSWKEMSNGPLVGCVGLIFFHLRPGVDNGHEFLPVAHGDRGFQTSSSSVLTAIMVAVNIPGNVMGGWLLQRG
jgi:hypothetical protein